MLGQSGGEASAELSKFADPLQVRAMQPTQRADPTRCSLELRFRPAVTADGRPVVAIAVVTAEAM
jgi:hypothetical protein